MAFFVPLSYHKNMADITIRFIFDHSIRFITEFGPRIVIILVLFVAAKMLLRRGVGRTMKIISTTKGLENDERAKRRAQTLGHVVLTIGNTVIYAIAILMLLNLFNISVAPILTGAGILGLAVGFGTQALVKDFVSGLFILVENQYGVGDRVKIGTLEGDVIKITIRSTVLRDAEGKISYIPNGTITNVVNFSQTEADATEKTPIPIGKE